MQSNTNLFNSNKENFTTHEAARWIGISNGSLFNLWKKGEGPRKVKIGRRTIVPKTCLQEWISSLQS